MGSLYRRALALDSVTEVQNFFLRVATPTHFDTNAIFLSRRSKKKKNRIQKQLLAAAFVEFLLRGENIHPIHSSGLDTGCVPSLLNSPRIREGVCFPLDDEKRVKNIGGIR